MGNCSLKTESVEPASIQINKNSFIFHAVIGSGGFGRVWRVEMKKGHKFYAMKETNKQLVIAKRSVHSIMNERKLLEVMNHLFIVNINFAFQDRTHLYLAMDLMTGGDLRYHINRIRRFTEEQSKFMAVCIIIGLEYIHSLNILHRDLKPENLVLDSRGYLRITDFGVARVYTQNNSKDTSGTPGYMAPEVLCRNNHTISVDYFALGVILYELMLGKRPYIGKNRAEIRDKVLSKQVQISTIEIPPGWSMEGADFINRLIQRKPSERLGCNGISELKSHSWFKGYPWKAVYEKTLEAPFIPPNGENYSKRQVFDWNNDYSKETSEFSQELFAGYEYREDMWDRSER